jgi:PAS domain-containing protein
MDLTARHQHYQALDLIHRPVWIFDIDLRRVHWANSAALRIWDAATLQALCERDMGVDMSASVAQRLAQYQIDFETKDAAFNEHWTLYPAGKPVTLNVRFSAHRIDDGRMAMFCEAIVAQDTTPESLRSVEALLHTPVMITLYGQQGRPLYRNPAARDSVRAPDETLAERIADTAAFERLLSTLAQRRGHADPGRAHRGRRTLARNIGAPLPRRRDRATPCW